MYRWIFNKSLRYSLTICPRCVSQEASIKLKPKKMYDNVLYGKPVANRILEKCKQDCDEYILKYDRQPRLTALLVGGHPSSKLYIKNKQKAAKRVGIEFNVVNPVMHSTHEAIVDLIQTLNNDDSVDGILLQLPLPLHLIDQTENLIQMIHADKDVDGFTTENYCQSTTMIPVVDAVHELLKEIGEPTKGKNVVVIGRSKYVGAPIALLLSRSTVLSNELVGDAHVTICHRETPLDNFKMHCKNADIIISAAGRPRLVTHDMVKKDVIVIDVGITKSSGSNTVFVGDVCFDEVRKSAKFITPVPGGVGQVTVACLLKNLLTLANRRVTKAFMNEQTNNHT
ncbi:unnamed protein product [Didymodactylos carnosus]|uniref:methenyltetrahydrofolate cyclohydrolase n=1 Tax=Didymodactylos carnosus TaxID=1234261 RepID=A0A815VEG0_9BILA|nr:unnamed protein product [Didymodactylos carnosus]CAF1533932.1 unnamed protein product [Didymodactylos carnosus]CAF4117746.1 unnamed protein product [Didymodactylos carnosus]CAF4393566.1 unnamed protein product [Didymodactylos carnosus]